jgi:hypothetical protein
VSGLNFWIPVQIVGACLCIVGTIIVGASWIQVAFRKGNAKNGISGPIALQFLTGSLLFNIAGLVFHWRFYSPGTGVYSLATWFLYYDLPTFLTVGFVFLCASISVSRTASRQVFFGSRVLFGISVLGFLLIALSLAFVQD